MDLPSQPPLVAAWLTNGPPNSASCGLLSAAGQQGERAALRARGERAADRTGPRGTRAAVSRHQARVTGGAGCGVPTLRVGFPLRRAPHRHSVPSAARPSPRAPR